MYHLSQPLISWWLIYSLPSLSLSLSMSLLLSLSLSFSMSHLLNSITLLFSTRSAPSLSSIHSSLIPPSGIITQLLALPRTLLPSLYHSRSSLPFFLSHSIFSCLHSIPHHHTLTLKSYVTLKTTPFFPSPPFFSINSFDLHHSINFPYLLNSLMESSLNNPYHPVTLKCYVTLKTTSFSLFPSLSFFSKFPHYTIQLHLPPLLFTQSPTWNHHSNPHPQLLTLKH